jgi:hypothetical protein
VIEIKLFLNMMAPLLNLNIPALRHMQTRR